MKDVVMVRKNIRNFAPERRCIDTHSLSLSRSEGGDECQNKKKER